MEYGKIQVRIVSQTDKACLVEIDELDEPEWLPWSTIEDNDEDFKNGYEGAMYVVTWKLDQLGVDYD